MNQTDPTFSKKTDFFTTTNTNATDRREEKEEEEEWKSVDEDELDHLFFSKTPTAPSLINTTTVSLPKPKLPPFSQIPLYSDINLAKTAEEVTKAYFEALRLHAEQLKTWAIMAPPDKPNLVTVPWQVDMTTQIPNKSELSKRTETSNATTQKKKPVEKKKGGKGKKKRN
jgi:hypothetical protein